jgi:hypothetical protein
VRLRQAFACDCGCGAETEGWHVGSVLAEGGEDARQVAGCEGAEGGERCADDGDADFDYGPV